MLPLCISYFSSYSMPVPFNYFLQGPPWKEKDFASPLFINKTINCKTVKHILSIFLHLEPSYELYYNVKI